MELLGSCKTNEDLEAVYEQFKQTIRTPWSMARSAVPPRYKDLWSRTHEQMFTGRSRLYNVAKISVDEEDWKRYKSLENLIKID